MSPKVSIIVPIYNVGEYIEKCTKSIMNQTYNNLEIILVNDGSKDNSLSIICSLAKEDNRIKVIDKQNAGVSAARNAGMSAASGEYIVFVDGDDFLADDYVEYMLSLARKNDADFCFSLNCYLFEGEEQVNHIKEIQLTPSEATGLLLSSRVSVGCWNKIYKKSVIDGYDIHFMEDLFYGEGLYFITSISQKSNKTICTNKKLYYYRRNNDTSATTNFNINAIRNGLLSLNRIKNDLAINTEYVTNMLSNHISSYHLMSVVKLRKSGQWKNYPDDYKQSLKYVRKCLLMDLLSKDVPLFSKVSKLVCAFSPALLGYLAGFRSNYTSWRSVK